MVYLTTSISITYLIQVLIHNFDYFVVVVFINVMNFRLREIVQACIGYCIYFITVIVISI